MLKIWIPFFLFFLFAEMSFGQKFLQLEKMHSPKTRKYYPGDEITFQLAGGQWYTRVIEDVSYERKLIIFANGHAELDSIISFRSYKTQKWSRPIGNQLYNFAIAWTGFSLIVPLVDEEDKYTKGDAIVAASSVALGFAIKQIFKRRTFDLKKNKQGESQRWRLRVLDLNVKPVK